MSIDNLLTVEQIEAAIAGANISGSVKGGIGEAQTFTPASHTPISGYGTDLKPRIRGANDEIVEQKLVTAPNVDRFIKQAADRELKAIKDAEKATRDHENLDPSKLLASINAMDRRLRKIEKQLKENSQ
ncbi:hypothetical protein SynPROS91_01131 [Synechococcus sp. PROS-9-1]|uniref:hypothetical protein n=1 Tax=Synechococcus sp. PROS-9-1 TaxID=1968775 RepID=UPI0016474EAA|nr:hypothetical protein [Synechococcus sp. PROS-9-1]QNJ31509.1 hypothetical protein SynPROS91_01131 [Synechococcus sp. PROS-9-1]